VDPLVQIARRRSLVVIVLAAAILGLLIYLLQRTPAVVDLGPFLEARLDGQPIPVTNEPRLEGFQAVGKYHSDVLEQTVYARPDGTSIVLLSAPARTHFRYGTARAFSTQISGIHCEKLDSAGQQTYAFYAAGRHYALIAKSCAPECAGNIMHQLGASL
jgi:hypothetical protein